MPSKKKKYNARFPAGRIKKIMQSDEEIGKVAQAVPVIIYIIIYIPFLCCLLLTLICLLHTPRTLELFVESLLTKTLKITNSRNAKTLSTSHMKQCIMSEQRFDFLRELVKNIPDISVAEEAANYNEDDGQSSPEENYPDSDTPYDLSMPSTSTRTDRSPALANGGGSTQATHSQYKSQRSQWQNGSSSDADSRQRLRQRLSVAAATTSVIMHTGAVTQAAGARSDYVQPLKLLRSESTPANATQQCWQVAAQSAQIPVLPPLPAQRQRLKHQSQSMACNNNNSNSGTPAKHRKLEPPQTAIPAPIFSYDLCNKPVVKIDYSNLPLTHAPTAATPASALPLSAPIINIDLSNIVANADSNQTGVAPPVATISIGAIPTASSSAFTPASATPPNQTVDSKAKAAATRTALPAVTTATPAKTPATTPSKSSNSFFELDEDYDNI